MRQIAEFIALLGCGLFTGAAVYISLVEHPSRMECGVEIAATEFPFGYRRASIMQATLAAVGLLSSIAAWLAGATFWWAVAGALLGSVIPFTLIVILPTNKQLLSPTLDRRSAQVGRYFHAGADCMLSESFSVFSHFCYSSTCQFSPNRRDGRSDCSHCSRRILNVKIKCSPRRDCHDRQAEISGTSLTETEACEQH